MAVIGRTESEKLVACCSHTTLVNLSWLIFLATTCFPGGRSFLGFVVGYEENKLDVKVWPEGPWTGRCVAATMVALY